jgi:PAS domain S-box-containing protein
MIPDPHHHPAEAVSSASSQALREELELLRERLREAEETLGAIRNGDVDAVVVCGPDSLPHVYTLETADQTYRLLVEEMQEGALTLTRGGDILYCNRRLAELLESSPEKVIGSSLRRFIGGAGWQVVLGLIDSQSKGEIGIRTDQGHIIQTHVSFSALRGDTLDSEELYCCIVTDLTAQQNAADQLREAHAALVAQVSEREKTERLLRQSQKMEAIGQLTGGIAHDFNNLLMVITGGLSILERSSETQRKKISDGMRQAAERGASLTRQLLAFSRQKELHPKPIELPHHVGEMRELLDGSLGGSITVRTDFAADVWPVQVDEGELEIALLNLCVNARDAMPQGGTITIAARNRPDIDDVQLRGDFVEVSVIDTGEGMDAATVSRCLEPFFTTKDVGKGSGLGLAQVYGFARGSEGAVQIESKLQQGTRVSLLLPRSARAPQATAVAAEEHGGLRPAYCKVLLVEDDVTVASLTEDMLRELGYEVNQVADARAGLKAVSEDHGYGLILSDVMMPGGMDGLAFVTEVRRRDAKLPVVLVTGFPDGVRKQAEEAGIPLLAKPYTLSDLASRLNAATAESEA